MLVLQVIGLPGRIQNRLNATDASRNVTSFSSICLAAVFFVSSPADGAPESLATGVLNTCFSDSADFENRQTEFLQLGWQVMPEVRLAEVSERIADTAFIFRAPSERNGDALKRMLETARTTTNNALRQKNGSFSKSVALVHSDNETAALWLSWVDNSSTSRLTCTFVSDDVEAGEALLGALSRSSAENDQDFRALNFAKEFPNAQPLAEAAGTVALLDKPAFEQLVGEPLSRTYSVTVSVTAKQ